LNAREKRKPEIILSCVFRLSTPPVFGDPKRGSCVDVVGFRVCLCGTRFFCVFSLYLPLFLIYLRFNGRGKEKENVLLSIRKWVSVVGNRSLTPYCVCVWVREKLSLICCCHQGVFLYFIGNCVHTKIIVGKSGTKKNLHKMIQCTWKFLPPTYPTLLEYTKKAPIPTNGLFFTSALRKLYFRRRVSIRVSCACRASMYFVVLPECRSG